jgi:hypothetical protein
VTIRLFAIEYRFNALPESARRRASLAAHESVMADNHRSVIGEITHGRYQCRKAGELGASAI